MYWVVISMFKAGVCYVSFGWVGFDAIVLGFWVVGMVVCCMFYIFRMC